MYMLSQAMQQAQVELGLKIIALWQCKVYSRYLPQVLECCYGVLVLFPIMYVEHSCTVQVKLEKFFHCCLLFRSIVLD